MLRFRLIVPLVFISQIAAAADPEQSAEPASSLSPSMANDRISAAIIVRRLTAMGYQSIVDLDDSGDPRVNISIDGHDRSIYFYDCGTGPRDDRECVSHQIDSGYSCATQPPRISSTNGTRSSAT